MKIGLLGFGVVGRGVYELASSRTDIQVAKVVCLEDITLPDAEVTKDFASVLADPTVDTVVEAMGGLHPSFEFVKAAMEAGKNVVTSNKALAATYFDTLVPLARKMGVAFRCTAAVGGGIGWLSELERTRRMQKLTFVGGIMNGTCNYILDAMTRLHMSYEDALARAQKLGYAEANPAMDVEGTDTWHKLILSANVGFGISLDTATVPVSGICGILASDVEQFTQRGLVCKLVSTGKMENGVCSAYVQPTLFSGGAPESAVQTNFNMITFVGESSGRMSFYGQGAGRYPTAYNVMQDCADVLAGKSFYCPYGEKTAATNTDRMAYYVRGEKDGWLNANTADTWGDAVLTKEVPVADMHSWLKTHPGAFAAALAVENT